MKKRQTSSDIERFTVPSPEVTTAVVSQQDTAEEEIFWHTKKGILWTSIFGGVLALAVVAGVFMYRAGTVKSIPLLATVPVLVKVPRISPISTSIPEVLDKSKYNIEVLNGSGIPGEAAKMKRLLEDENFTVSSIGNTESSDYKKTIIQAKETTPKEFLEKLISSLEKTYVVNDSIEVSATGEADIIIIIGEEKIND